MRQRPRRSRSQGPRTTLDFAKCYALRNALRRSTELSSGRVRQTSTVRTRGQPFLWRWGRVELPVQDHRTIRVYEACPANFDLAGPDARRRAPGPARSAVLGPLTDHRRAAPPLSRPHRSAEVGPVGRSLTRQRVRKSCWQLSACRSVHGVNGNPGSRRIALLPCRNHASP